MMKVLVTQKLNEQQKEKFLNTSNKYEFIFADNNVSEDIIKDADIIIGGLSPQRINHSEKLKWIQIVAVGYDNYVYPGAMNENTIITNAVDVHSQEVSEHIVALMMDLLKNLHLYRDNQTAKNWHDEGKVKSIRNLKVTIVGFGSIGRYLAKILNAMGCLVTGVKRTVEKIPYYLSNLLPASQLDEAIKDADVVICVVPGSQENENLFTKERFATMRNDAIFINCGRGNLYENAVLADALNNNVIRAAAIDVARVEPIPNDDPLYSCKNLVITPHVAGFFHLDDALDTFVDLATDNLKRYAENRELRNVVER